MGQDLAFSEWVWVLYVGNGPDQYTMRIGVSCCGLAWLSRNGHGCFMLGMGQTVTVCVAVVHEKNDMIVYLYLVNGTTSWVVNSF